MKVLHLIDSEGLYGAEKVILHLARCQADKGLDVGIGIMSDLKDAPKPLEIAAQAVGVKTSRLLARPGVDVGFHVRLGAYIRREEIDVLHVHGYRANILANIAPRAQRKSYVTVTTLHGYTHTSLISKIGCIFLADQAMALRSDVIVAVSRKLQRTGVCRWARRKCEFIPNGIPAVKETSSDESLKSIITFIGAKPTLLVVGRLSPEKSQALAVEAMSRLAAADHDIQLLILGDGPLRSELQSQIAAAGLADRVCMPGYVSNASRLMPLCVAMLITSTTEGLPITLLEAMQQELPVISTPVGEIPAAVGENAGAWMFKVGDVVGLVDAILDELFNPAESEKRKKYAAERLRSSYSVEFTERMYRSLYSRLMRTNGDAL